MTPMEGKVKFTTSGEITVPVSFSFPSIDSDPRFWIGFLWPNIDQVTVEWLVWLSMFIDDPFRPY